MDVKTRKSGGRRSRRLGRQGFTLIEMIVATLILSIGIVGVFGGIRALGAAETKARTLELLQSLAATEMSQIGPVTDPNSVDTSGDFNAQGYPNVTYTVNVETTDTTNISKVTVTTTQGKESQTLTQLVYIPAETGTTTGTTSTGGTQR